MNKPHRPKGSFSWRRSRAEKLILSCQKLYIMISVLVISTSNYRWFYYYGCQEIYSTTDFTNSSWPGNDYWHYYLSDSVSYISLSHHSTLIIYTSISILDKLKSVWERTKQCRKKYKVSPMTMSSLLLWGRYYQHLNKSFQFEAIILEPHGADNISIFPYQLLV